MIQGEYGFVIIFAIGFVAGKWWSENNTDGGPR